MKVCLSRLTFGAIGCFLFMVTVLWIKEVVKYRKQVMHLDRCPLGVTFSQKTLPLTALASMPGCGNTWLRHLIQEMTGVATGSLRVDKELQDGGFIGEGCTNNSVVVIKTHHVYDLGKDGYTKCILLIRNPFEAMRADFSMRVSFSHVGLLRGLDKREWKKFLQRTIQNWKTFYQSWLLMDDLILVLYDDLKTNLLEVLLRVDVFLANDHHQTDVSCALVNSEGRFHRPHHSEVFEMEDVVFVNDLIDDLIDKLRNRFPQVVDVMEKWKRQFHEQRD